jgi:hypothetical protein
LCTEKRNNFHKSGDWVTFRYWRNKCKTLIEKSKLEYFQKIVEENKEPKEIWKLFKLEHHWSFLFEKNLYFGGWKGKDFYQFFFKNICI